MILRVLKFGGGVESTGAICGYQEREDKPDAIVFADTGGEIPRTYANVDAVDALIQSWGWEPIVRVAEKKTLEQHCLDTRRMPSVSYGRKSCSVRFKVEPFERWIKGWGPAVAAWTAGQKVTVVIGYNVDEVARWSKAPPPSARFTYDYPLVAWKWSREDCLAACHRFRLDPCKSACFFCGSARKPEVRHLREDAPGLFARAVSMERNARPFFGSIQGLGKRFSWEEMADADDRQGALFEPEDEAGEVDIDCECHEGVAT